MGYRPYSQRKAYVYTLFETFSNQPFWELHENVKNNMKNKCIVKIVILKQGYSRTLCLCFYECSPDLLLLTKRAVFLQNASGNPTWAIWSTWYAMPVCDVIVITMISRILHAVVDFVMIILSIRWWSCALYRTVTRQSSIGGLYAVE